MRRRCAGSFATTLAGLQSGKKPTTYRPKGTRGRFMQKVLAKLKKSLYPVIMGTAVLVATGCVSNVCGNAGPLDQDAQAYCDNQTQQANFQRGQEIGAAAREVTDDLAIAIVDVLATGLSGLSSVPPAVPGSSPGFAPVFPSPPPVQPAQAEYRPSWGSLLPPPAPPIQPPDIGSTLLNASNEASRP